MLIYLFLKIYKQLATTECIMYPYEYSLKARLEDFCFKRIRSEGIYSYVQMYVVVYLIVTMQFHI